MTVCLGHKIPQISVQLSIYGMCWTNPIHCGPTSQLVGFKGFFANILGSDTFSRAVLAAHGGTYTIFWLHVIIFK